MLPQWMSPGKQKGRRKPLSPLYGSESFSGGKDQLIAILLDGEQGQISVSGPIYENTVLKRALLSDE